MNDGTMETLLHGMVVESTGSRYKVLADDGIVVDCRIRGKLRLKGMRSTNPVVVGDRVSFELLPDGEGGITAVEERRNYIIRRASNLSKESHIIAVNIDLALVVVTLAQPQTNTEFIDRFLVTCEAYHIPALIVLNKCDLLQGMEPLVAGFVDAYAKAGYETVCVSAMHGEGMERIAEAVRDKTTLLSGNSGVGKSTIVKALEPDAEVRVGEISDVHLKGKHTTTFSRVYKLRGGGNLIDTPGIKGFGLIDIDRNELWHYFPEFMHFAGGCRFYNCTHTHEPGCAVVEAVENGRIAFSRYESYLKILDEDGKYRQ